MENKTKSVNTWVFYQLSSSDLKTGHRAISSLDNRFLCITRLGSFLQSTKSVPPEICVFIMSPAFFTLRTNLMAQGYSHFVFCGSSALLAQ